MNGHHSAEAGWVDSSGDLWLFPWRFKRLWLEWVIMKPFLITIALSLVSGLPLSAQIAIPPGNATAFRDTSMLKPPSGAKVAIIEFEDLECPLCAQVSPLVRAAMSRYHIPRVHHDFIIQGHAWSRTGAIYARYLEDKVAPQVAEDFRRDVFANQRLIAGQDDLQQFTRRWFQSHGQQMPFVIDPSGRCAAEVEADCKLGLRLGVLHTPTVIVVTAHQWIEVTEPNQLYAAIDRAESEANTSTPHARSNVRK
jgi:protein-disulfide isomerase